MTLSGKAYCPRCKQVVDVESDDNVEHRCMLCGKVILTEDTAFVVYDELGTPLAYLIKTYDEPSEEEMTAIMDLFPSAVDNAWVTVRWQEL